MIHLTLSSRLIHFGCMLHRIRPFSWQRKMTNSSPWNSFLRKSVIVPSSFHTNSRSFCFWNNVLSKPCLHENAINRSDAGFWVFPGSILTKPVLLGSWWLSEKNRNCEIILEMAYEFLLKICLPSTLLPAWENIEKLDLAQNLSLVGV